MKDELMKRLKRILFHGKKENSETKSGQHMHQGGEIIISRKEIKKLLRALLLNRPAPICIVLKGEWGIGKTHLWKEFVKEEIKGKKTYAYISLFGKNSLEDIKNDINLQISLFNRIKKKLSSKIKELNKLKIFETHISTLSVILSFVPEKESRGTIICFDEFDRMSDNLKIKEILGLVSYLKENLKCDVVLIMDEDKLEKEIRETFDDYREKLVDYEIELNPDVKENLEIVLNEDAHLQNIPREVFKTFILKNEEKNIRIMRRLINALKDFEFIEEIKELKECKNLKVSIYEEMLYKVYTKLKKSQSKEIKNDNEKKDTPVEDMLEDMVEDLMKNLNLPNKPPQVTKFYIDKYIETGFLNEKAKDEIAKDLKSICRLIREEGKEKEIFDYINCIYEDFIYNYQVDSKTLSENLIRFIKENRENIIKMAEEKYKLWDFVFKLLFINQFLEEEHIDETRKLLKSVFEHFLEKRPVQFFFDINNIHALKEYIERIKDKDVRKEFEELLKKRQEVIKEELLNNIDCERLKEILRKILTPIQVGTNIGYGWDEKDGYILKNISTKKDLIKECLQRDKEFAKLALDLCKNNFSSFSSFISAVVEVLEKDLNIDEKRKNKILEQIGKA